MGLTKVLQNKRKRSWGRHPERDSKADWTLRLRLEGSGKTILYYVHTKLFQNMPPRRVPYFEKIFHKSMVDFGQRETELSIRDNDVAGFEILLDFMYCLTWKQEQKFISNIKYGEALYAFAKRNNIPSLRKMLSEFYKAHSLRFVDEDETETLNPRTDFLHLEYSSELDQFARNMHDVEYVEEKYLEPGFLLKALERRNTGRPPILEEESIKVSNVIAACLTKHKDNITRLRFFQLTGGDFIPFVGQEAAVQFMLLEGELGFWVGDGNFSSLEGRCIRAFLNLNDWERFCKKFRSSAAVWKTVRRFPPNVAGFLLWHYTGKDDNSDRIEHVKYANQLIPYVP